MNLFVILPFQIQTFGNAIISIFTPTPFEITVYLTEMGARRTWLKHAGARRQLLKHMGADDKLPFLLPLNHYKI